MTRTGYDWGSFKGYSPPIYTQIPNEMLDEHLARLSGAEVKVLLYIARRTFGWNKPSDAISLKQMLHGITRKDGVKTDHGAGVSRSTLIAALDGLEAKGLLLRHRGTDKKTHEISVYALKTDGSEIEPTHGEASSEIEPTPSPKIEPTVGSEIEPTKETQDQKKDETKEPLLLRAEEIEEIETWPSPPTVWAIFDVWLAGLHQHLSPDLQRERTPKREADIRNALERMAKTQTPAGAEASCRDAVLGWRWDDWRGRAQVNDLEDCLRPANLEQFRDWERGINRPLKSANTRPTRAGINGNGPAPPSPSDVDEENAKRLKAWADSGLEA